MLMVSPRKLRVMTEVRIDSGIETAMIRVLRQLPRKSRIIRAVRHAAMIASWITPITAPRTKTDWSAIRSTLSSGGSVLATRGTAARMLSTTSRVEASPLLSTVRTVPRRPSRRTMLVWIAEAVADVGDVPEVDGRVAHHLDRNVGQVR